MAIIRANNNTLSSVTALPFATGGLVKLVSSTNGGTNPSITFDLTSATIGTTYKAYKIFGHNLSSFSASNPNLNMFFGTASDTFSTQIQKAGIRNHTNSSGGANSISYTDWHNSGQTDTGGAAVVYYVPSTGEHHTFEITLFAINDSSVKARYHGHLNFNASSNYIFTSIINGRFNATTITPYVKFEASSGNYAGTITAYGIVD